MMDYFTLFSLKAQFPLNSNDLNTRYFSLQQHYHPDRFSGLPETERIAALQKSMQLNEAYETLKSPIKRAAYLLALQGIAVNSEKDSIKPEQALLMENLELREQLMEAESLDEVTALEALARKQKDDALEKFATYYENNAFEAAAQQVIRLRYALKFADEAKAKRIKHHVI